MINTRFTVHCTILHQNVIFMMSKQRNERFIANACLGLLIVKSIDIQRQTQLNQGCKLWLAGLSEVFFIIHAHTQ